MNGIWDTTLNLPNFKVLTVKMSDELEFSTFKFSKITIVEFKEKILKALYS